MLFTWHYSVHWKKISPTGVYFTEWQKRNYFKFWQKLLHSVIVSIKKSISQCDKFVFQTASLFQSLTAISVA